ncbi:permease [Halomicroarcula sp. F27]|uniref:Permease n=1 Tax=Haloarcula nitratireducens TaxID=2487749 RepID=A0AAW4PJG5_9EURY|nr:permease [Halomicroarcula nitratireducens]MBX0298277.1 permease [Halomicroarcula nitratireducens]
MEKKEYAILAVIALATVALGVFTTSKPLVPFFVESTRQFLSTTAAMAWITWWALVIGFAIAGGVEAWTSDEKVSDLLDGHGLRELGYGSLFGFVSSSCSYSAIATAKNLFKKGGSAAATIGRDELQDGPERARDDLLPVPLLASQLGFGWRGGTRRARSRRRLTISVFPDCQPY